MIQNRTVIKIVDNTDVTLVRCFKPRNLRRLGDLVTGSVIKTAAGSSSFKRGDVVHALIVNTTWNKANKSGINTKFATNSGVIMANQGKEGWLPVGTRINTALPRVLRDKGWANVVSLARHIV